MAVAMVVGSMVGSGAFLLPASLAPLGWNSVYGWLITIGGILCLAFTFARMARDLPGGSGPLTYPQIAFGDGIGFLVSWSYWISLITANATLAVAAVSNLSVFWPALGTISGAPAAAAIAILWIFTGINCLGVRSAGEVQVITTVLKLIPLIGAIGVGLWVMLSHGTATLAPYHPQSISFADISTATTLTLFAMFGFECALVAGDRVENPERVIPLATLLGAGIIGVIYLFACSAVTLLLPASDVTQSNAPFTLLFSHFTNPAIGASVALFAAIAAIGTLNGYVLLQGELLLALAKDRLLPRHFVKVSRRDVPVFAEVLSSAIATLIVLSNYARGLSDLFIFMMLVTTSVSLIFYIVGAMGAIRMVRRQIIRNSPGFIMITLVGLLYGLWTFYGAGLEAGAWGLLMTATGIPIYWIMKRSAAATEPS